MARLVTRAAAKRDIAAAARWYNRERPGLGDEFVTAVADKIAEIRRTPERFPVWQGEIRRAVMDRFPYAVSFAARPHEVVILACTHHRRHPRRWQRRR